jgi:ABC-type lipoprotein release transport system permease subunit
VGSGRETGPTPPAGFIRNLLFGVEPNDPLTLLVVAMLLAFVAVGAILLPVQRATLLDPARVLSEQ